MTNVAITGIGSSDDEAAPTTASPVKSRHRPALRILVWTAGIVVIFGMLGAVMLPSLCRASETANRIKCMSNLRQIGQAITLYAQSNGGQYPPSLAVLIGQQQMAPAILVCPSSNDVAASGADSAAKIAELTAAETNAAGHEDCLSYVYTGSALNVKTASATAVVAYEPLTNHGGAGTDVLFGDGHVEFIGKQSWPKVAADAGLSIVPLPTNPS